MSSLLQPGDTVGQYEVVRRLGSGAMGVVYLASHRHLRRNVALKVMSADLSNDDHFRRRFLREAQLVSDVHSQHVVTVHDAGEHSDLLFIVMAYHPAGDLEAHLSGGRSLAPAGALRLVSGLADGLIQLHARGVLHRDVKPANILLWSDSESRLNGALADFGIAKAEDVTATVTNGVIGTAAYMAPERHLGQEAVPETDVYALGCVLWRAVAGKLPYEGGPGAQAVHHVSAPVPQLPPEHAGAGLLNDLLARLLAKNPADRPDAVGTVRLIADVSAGTPKRHEPKPPPKPTPSAASSVPGLPPTKVAPPQIVGRLPDASWGGLRYSAPIVTGDATGFSARVEGLPNRFRYNPHSGAIEGNADSAGTWDISVALVAPGGHEERRLLTFTVQPRLSIVAVSDDIKPVNSFVGLNSVRFHQEDFIPRVGHRVRRNCKYVWDFAVVGGVGPMRVRQSGARRRGPDETKTAKGIESSVIVLEDGRTIRVSVWSTRHAKPGVWRGTFFVDDKWSSEQKFSVRLDFR